jgi:hypothetical protein
VGVLNTEMINERLEMRDEKFEIKNRIERQQ